MDPEFEDDGPINQPEFRGRVIISAQVVHGTESGEKVVLLGREWHATIHHVENFGGASYLSVGFFQRPHETLIHADHAAVTPVDALHGVTVSSAVSIRFEGASAFEIWADGGQRVMFVAGSEPGTIDIDESLSR